jgi:hypothetical protein
MILPVLALLLAPGALMAQAQGAWSGCKADSLSIWNCAQYYSGTVTYTSELKGTGLNETLSVVATITAGRATCKLKGSEVGEFEGPGMVAVEHGSTMNSGEFKIDVWCPESEGERPTRRDSPLIKVMNQRAVDYGTLNGKDSWEHSSADAANGITGTETITWQLRRM